MKLSEAIRLGAMATEHATHALQRIGRNGSIVTCALGSALYAVGQRLDGSAAYDYIGARWQWVVSHLVLCPGCCGCHNQHHPREIIIHLNDSHHWSRERIAYWVAMIEPQEQLPLEDQREEQPKSEVVVVAQ